MANFKDIIRKLETFLKRYYTNELIKGTLLFISLGFTYFLFTLFVEYVFWLNSALRTILFWLFVMVELALFVKYIAFPLAKLFKLKKGINYQEAATIIGKHFPEVNDKLLNVLQLNQDKEQSELLVASINQKSAELNPVPFKLAISFTDNRKYLKYAAIPVLIILISYFSGKIDWFSDSYERVVNYQTAYEPPAPFQFFVVNEDLEAIENTDFRLQVKTAGTVIPDNAKITYNNETYFLKQIGVGEFEYVFTKPKSDIEFNFSANSVVSRSYELEVLKVPTILGFEMLLDYPSHTKKTDEILKGNGNATVPQGTEITWQVKTRSTDQVLLYANDTTVFENVRDNGFEATKRLSNSLDYTISASNEFVSNYETLNFNIDVVKDDFPELNVKMELDSTDQQTMYFYGQASDDYGLQKLQLVYYPLNDVKNVKTESIPISKGNIDDFVSAFPNNLNLEEGVSYELYFQVFDNDALNRFKSTKSNFYTYRKLTESEEEDKQLQQQNETIQDLNESLEKMKTREKELEEFSQTQKEKSELNLTIKRNSKTS